MIKIQQADQKAEYMDHMGNDLAVIQAAKVSFNADHDVQRFISDIEAEGLGCKSHERLIRYLARHGHWTPFAHTAFKLRMRAPLPQRTHCFKHKVGFVENEQSLRYIVAEPEFYIPQKFRESCDNKKQGSGGPMGPLLQGRMLEIFKDSFERDYDNYLWVLKQGLCEEQARYLLPQGVMVNWMWTGNLAGFARFFNQRTHETAQYETAVLADMVAELVEPLFPYTWRYLTGGDQ